MKGNQNASASPPYRSGRSFKSMSGRSSFPIVCEPVPTTLIFASVWAEMSGLNSQKIHVKIEGTLTKNFLY